MKNTYIYIVVLLLTFSQALAQTDRSKLPAPGPAPQINLGEYESFTLKNGLKVFVIQNDKLPRIAFSLILDVDPVMEGEQAGYISMAGQLMRNGTKTRTKEQLDEEVDFIGASLSTSSTGIYASSLSKHTDKLMALMSDVLLNPSFPVEELEKLKKRTLSGLQSSKDNPNAISSNVSNVVRYGAAHPYGEIETEATIEKIDLQSCINYYNTYFKPNVAYLAIVGDINKKDAEKLVNKYFGGWKKGTVPTHSYPAQVAPAKTKVVVVDRPSSVQSVINITYPVDLKPGTPEAIKTRVMNQILGGSGTARLFMNLREDKAFTYGAYSSLSADELVGTFSANASVRNEVTDSAVVELLYEMNKIVKEKVTEEELQKVKNNITGSFARSLENPSTIASFALNIERYKLPKDYYANYLKTVEALTLEDIQATARQFVRPDNAYIVIVGNGKQIVPGLGKFGEIEYRDVYGKVYVPEVTDIPQGLTAAKVIENYINALGGKAKIEALKSINTEMAASVQGMNLTMKVVKTNSGKFLNEVSMPGMTISKTVINGDKGYTVMQGQKMNLEGDKLKEALQQADMFAEMNYEKNGVKTNLLGIEDVEGNKAYAIEVENAAGKKSTSYFDVQSGLKVKEATTVDTPNGPFNTSVSFSDYREVEGIKVPYVMTINQGMVIKAEVKTVEINGELAEGLFTIE
ncbi:pitrilysin family protein [Cytophagales bacterium LB-30]|uniref:Pitrilysin family protein n=1 Tax=Shiella aurantiaca TaxID=3058365 RepID=A0ABT8F6T3_9BACT|nr:pitrilysin family protein [Shiella aurantiaca]MDN4166177.1 pitrilysin family protein [Shiella aurantiaca]